MVSGAVLAIGLAVALWPGPSAARRLRALTAAEPRWRGARRLPRPRTFVLVLALVAAGWPLAGPAGAFAGAAVGVTGWWNWRTRRRLRRGIETTDGLAEALRSFVAELRAGAHPALAAESAAADAQPYAAAAMRAVAAATRLGGDVERALARSRDELPELAGVLGELGRAWSLVQRHGLPLANVLDAVVHDLDHRVRFARQVQARMAGPNASATVLALLPAVGLVLGEAMGAGPLRVLIGTEIGQVLLVLGSALVCAGVGWSARLTRQAVVA
jgi:tight adherence protein B